MPDTIFNHVFSLPEERTQLREAIAEISNLSHSLGNLDGSRTVNVAVVAAMSSPEPETEPTSVHDTQPQPEAVKPEAIYHTDSNDGIVIDEQPTA